MALEYLKLGLLIFVGIIITILGGLFFIILALGNKGLRGGRLGFFFLYFCLAVIVIGFGTFICFHVVPTMYAESLNL